MYEKDNRVELNLNYMSKNYPFANLAEGESFFVPKEDHPINSVRTAAHYAAKKLGVKFRVFAEDGGSRVFRVPQKKEGDA